LVEKKSKDQMVRQLGKNERIPYDLLFLADPTEEAINKYIFNSEIYVLEQDDRIIGVYVLQAVGEDEVEIKNIAVAANHQGRGIGRFLLRDAVARAIAGGFKAIIVGTGDASTRQLRLYRGEGFEAFGLRKNYFVDNYPKPIYENRMRLKDMVILRKRLDASR
jgi:ribosomal protein S18 acetylase RimI-like enzyme